MNIVLCGFMGCGKTTVGKELARITGRKFVDTDEMIEQQEGVSISEIFETKGEAYFRGLEHEICKKTCGLKNAVISTGGGAMTFERNVSAIRENSKIIFLDASFETVCERVKNGETRPLFRDKNKAKQLFDERKSKYVHAADYIADGNLSPSLTASNIAEWFQSV